MCLHLRGSTEGVVEHAHGMEAMRPKAAAGRAALCVGILGVDGCSSLAIRDEPYVARLSCMSRAKVVGNQTKEGNGRQ